MKYKYFIVVFFVCVLLFVLLVIWNALPPFTPAYHFGETNCHGNKVMPLLDAESQSNLEVIVNGGDDKQSCPPELTNTISNTNLFTLEEQQLLKSIPVLYGHVTPTSGPPGTVPVHLGWLDRWLGKVRFQFTNSDMQDELMVHHGRLFGPHIIRNKTGNGYDIYDGPYADNSSAYGGPGISFMLIQIKHGGHHGVYPGVYNGLYVQIQGEHCIQWMRFSNGMAVDKWLYWDPDGTNLDIWAKFKEPYDYMKYSRRK